MDLLNEKIKKISYTIIAFYFVIGTLDLIQFKNQNGATISVLDYIFLNIFEIKKERTYTKPFGKFLKPDPHFETPVGFHLLGTDINGNDVLFLTLKSSKTALLLSIGVCIVSFPIGMILGLISGYFGGFVDEIIQWLYTTIASIPWLLFVITFLMIFGKGIFWIILAIGLTSWVELARLIRGETLKLREIAFVKSAKISGKSSLRILIEEILPNTYPIVRITFALSSSHIILAETILTFIGIGIEPGSISWGIMISESQRELMRDPPIWWNFFSASFIGILPLILSLNLIAEEK